MTSYITSQSIFMIWECAQCHRQRHWGFGRPDPTHNPAPVLGCSICGKTTIHEYSHLVYNRDGHLFIDWGDYMNVREPQPRNAKAQLDW